MQIRVKKDSKSFMFMNKLNNNKYGIQILYFKNNLKSKLHAQNKNCQLYIKIGIRFINVISLEYRDFSLDTYYNKIVNIDLDNGKYIFRILPSDIKTYPEFGRLQNHDEESSLHIKIITL